MEPELYKELTQNTEMSPADHAFILELLHRVNPEKLVEIGVSAGGTSKLLLNSLPRTAALHSVDIDQRYVRNAAKKTGYIAQASYDPATQARWVTWFGMDIASCVEQIGPEIDCVILDTVHSLPGEFLSFLAVFPYLKDNALLILHDIGAHVLYKITEEHVAPHKQCQYCTPLLFSSIFSKNKFVSSETVPNCGAMILDKNYVMEHMGMVMNMLFLDWSYMPPPKILTDTLKILKKHYSPYHMALFEQAMKYNLALGSRARATAKE